MSINIEKLETWIEENGLPKGLMLSGTPYWTLSGDGTISQWMYEIPKPTIDEINSITTDKIKSCKKKNKLLRLKQNELWPIIEKLIEKLMEKTLTTQEKDDLIDSL